MIPHLVVSGVTSCDSRGVEALVRSIIAGVQKRGRWRTTVLTQTPVADAALVDLPSTRFVADPFVVSCSLRRSAPPPEEALAAQQRSLLAGADLMIATGGDIYTFDYGVSTRYLAAPRAALNDGVPVAMLAHSVGPFTQAEEAAAWVSVAADCQVLTLRESVSLRHVVDDLGISDGAATLTADPAFLLSPAPPARVDQVLTDVGLDPAEPFICLAPSRGIAHFRDLDMRRRLLTLQKVVRRLAARFRVPILLVPHAHDSRPENDDRLLTTELVRLDDDAVTRPLVASLNATEYKAIMGRSMLTVAERLHAAIAAMSSGVPTAAIGYSRKFVGILSDTYGETIPLEEIYLDVNAAHEDERIVARLVDALEVDALRAQLVSRLPLIMERAESNFARADNCVKRKS
jgi:colanic acid/amylovoran biosynthesis protein